MLDHSNHGCTMEINALKKAKLGYKMRKAFKTILIEVFLMGPKSILRGVNGKTF